MYFGLTMCPVLCLLPTYGTGTVIGCAPPECSAGHPIVRGCHPLAVIQLVSIVGPGKPTTWPLAQGQAWVPPWKLRTGLIPAPSAWSLEGKGWFGDYRLPCRLESKKTDQKIRERWEMGQGRWGGGNCARESCALAHACSPAAPWPQDSVGPLHWTQMQLVSFVMLLWVSVGLQLEASSLISSTSKL